MTVEEYRRLDEFNENGRRTELIRGIVIEKMSKSPRHSTIASLLYKLISGQLPKGFLVRKEEPLTFDEDDSEPEPDISVMRGREKDFVEAHPTTAELAIEVAVSSAALDRENASLYAEAGVKEYWIVLGRRRQVEVYRRLERGRYQDRQTFQIGDVIECNSVPGVRLQLTELFA